MALNDGANDEGTEVEMGHVSAIAALFATNHPPSLQKKIAVAEWGEGRSHFRKPGSHMALPLTPIKLGHGRQNRSNCGSGTAFYRKWNKYQLPNLLTLYRREESEGSTAFAQTQKSPLSGLEVGAYATSFTAAISASEKV